MRRLTALSFVVVVGCTVEAGTLRWEDIEGVPPEILSSDAERIDELATQLALLQLRHEEALARLTTVETRLGILESRLVLGEQPLVVLTANLGLVRTATSIRLTGANGRSLSESNPGYVRVPRSNSPNQDVVISVTNPSHALGFGQFIETFGTTPGRVWDSTGVTAASRIQDAERPFGLYAVNSNDQEDGLAFAFCPNPTRRKGLPSNWIAFPSVRAVPDHSPDEACFFIPNDNVPNPRVTHVDKPMALIGSVRATKDARDSWTIVEFDYGDGVGRLWNFGGRRFALPPGHMGAAIGQWMPQPPTGNAPTSRFNEYGYVLGTDGRVTVFLDFEQHDVDGMGDEPVRLVLPYRSYRAMTNQPYGMAIQCFYGAGWHSNCMVAGGSGSSEFGLRTMGTAGGGTPSTPLTNLDFASTGEIRGQFTYLAFQME